MMLLFVFINFVSPSGSELAHWFIPLAAKLANIKFH